MIRYIIVYMGVLDKYIFLHLLSSNNWNRIIKKKLSHLNTVNSVILIVILDS